MVATTPITPSRVFPLPGYTGPIVEHGKGNFGGSDIFAPVGTPIVNMVNGKVTFISTATSAPTSGGNAVQIQGNDGLTYYYAHLRDLPLVKNGDSVVAGQALGFVGKTGNAASTPSHLHIGIGHGISIGVGPAGGIGQNFDAVGLLNALKLDNRANDPAIIGSTPNPPTIKYVPAVPGFDSTHLSDIMLNVKKAMQAQIDPFLWLGIVSKESTFDSNAKNPTSGACGYAQIYPCIPGLTPEQNIEEGLKRLKAFITQCGGDLNCALNLYSGGGGQSYITDVQSRATKIKNVNGDLGNADPNFDPTLPDTPLGSNAEKCPPIVVEIGPLKVPFPDVGCIINTTIGDLQDQLAGWWKNWQVQNVPNLVFILGGILLLALGIIGLVQQAGGGIPTLPKATEAAVVS